MVHSGTADYMAHGVCFLWEPALVWLHVISDVATGMAYYSIPAAIFYFVYKRRDVPFLGMFVLFGVFIFSCGTTHLLAAYTVYDPLYWHEGVVKAITGFVSIVAAFLFIPLIPKAIALPSLQKALEEIKSLNKTLEKQVEELRIKDSAIASAPNAIAFADLGGRLTYVNSAFLELWGYGGKEDVLGRPASDFWEAEDHALGVIEALRSTGNWSGELSAKRREGKVFVAELVGSMVLGEKGNPICFMTSFTDITERKRAEEENNRLQEQLRQSQKMEAIGQLAGGIAHDFNNILSAIIGYGHLMDIKMSEDNPLRFNVKQILESADRAAHLTSNLLAFSRKQVINPRPINVNELVGKVETFLSRIIGEDVELMTVLEERDLTVMADSGQIEQVLMNLVTNARDAMPKGGRLTIRTELVEPDDASVRVHGLGEVAAYARISVSDTGTGMDEETRAKIFEPFFTTKEVGKGTGLGLAMVYGIISQHSGYITVQSEPGEGTVFDVYLPTLKTGAVEEQPVLSEPPPVGGPETILLAEDDAAVRKLIEVVLRDFGYNVIAAEDGEAAVKKFFEHKDDIRLCLLDMIMPKKNGREAYEEIRKIRPGIRTIFVSGYTADIVQKEGVLEEGIDLILKPVSPKDLLKKVRETLDA